MKTSYFSMMCVFAAAACTGSVHAQVINEDLKLLPSEGAFLDIFGWSIAIDNGVVAVGVPNDDDNGTDSGSAYLFDAATGAQLFKLLPTDGAEDEKFGDSIAINNGVVAVTAHLDDDNGIDSGSAYLFDAATGAQLFKLLPSDGAAFDHFGRSIAINNGIVAVGANGDGDNGNRSGSAYLFDADTGAQIRKLLPSDGDDGDAFGRSIAINNGVVAVGAFLDEVNGPASGSAYLFDAATGAEFFKLLPADGAVADFFGISIAINNGVVAVGAPNDADNGSFSGSVYLFDIDTGAQLLKLLPSDGAMNDLFGISVAIDNGLVAVGAVNHIDNSSISGSAFLFDVATGAQFAKLVPSDGASADDLGASIAIDNGVVAVGAPNDDDNGNSSGSAYLFAVPPPPCLADLTGDGVLNFFDIAEFITLFNLQDPIVDFTNDGSFNFFDVSEFLIAFSKGCP